MQNWILCVAFMLICLNSISAQHIQPARRVWVDDAYLGDVDQGKQPAPIVISRKQGEQLDLVLPHLYRTSATLWDEVTYRKFLKRPGPYHPIQRNGSGAEEKGPEIVFNLSKLKDGAYYIWLAGDSAAGDFQVQLKTE